MVIDKEKYFKEKENIIKFILENDKLYNDQKFEMIYFTFLFDNILNSKNIMHTEMAALVSKFGILKQGNDIYFKFYQLLEQLGFIKGNILEVGSGPYPRLAEIIRDNHKTNDYNLTIYEKRDVFSIDKKIKIVKDKFTASTDIESIDTIFGLYPCEASIDMTLKGIKENKNLLIAFCNCDHSTEKYPHWFGDYWAVDFCSAIKKEYQDEVEIINNQITPKVKLPILIHKKRISK